MARCRAGGLVPNSTTVLRHRLAEDLDGAHVLEMDLGLAGPWVTRLAGDLDLDPAGARSGSPSWRWRTGRPRRTPRPGARGRRARHARGGSVTGSPRTWTARTCSRWTWGSPTLGDSARRRPRPRPGRRGGRLADRGDQREALDRGSGSPSWRRRTGRPRRPPRPGARGQGARHGKMP